MLPVLEAKPCSEAETDTLKRKREDNLHRQCQNGRDVRGIEEGSSIWSLFSVPPFELLERRDRGIVSVAADYSFAFHARFKSRIVFSQTKPASHGTTFADDADARIHAGTGTDPPPH